MKLQQNWSINEGARAITMCKGNRIEGRKNSRLEDNFHMDGLPIVFLG